MPLSDDELYLRGMATLLASWQEYARCSSGAAVPRGSGVTAAVFPSEPERAYYNNAVLDRGLAAPERAAAIDEMQAAYAAAGVERFAAWVHAEAEGVCRDLATRGYRIDETTVAMGMALDDVHPPSSDVEIAQAAWTEYLRILGVPAGLLDGADSSAFHVLVGRLDGDNVAAAMAFDHDRDCGIFNLTTLASARRRGLGTALTVRHAYDATVRGCTSASLRSTPMAERVYRAVGFRDLGRILEYVR